MELSSWCDRVIRWGFILLFALVPLLLTPWNYELFEYNKMMGVYVLTIIITGAWLVKGMRQGEFRITRTPLDIPIGLFVASQLVSSIFSIDPHISWFGYYSRFNGGMWSIICYVLLYYAFVSNLSETGRQSDSKTVSKNAYFLPSYNVAGLTVSHLLKVCLASGVVVALYGVAERLGIDKHLWVQDVQNRVFSTLGQPNWLAAYLAALSPIAMAMAIVTGNKRQETSKGISNYFFVACRLSLVALFFIVLLFTRSRSGLLGFAVADGAFWGLVFGLLWMPQQQSKALQRVAIPFLLLHFFFFLIIFFNGTSIDGVDKWATLNAWKQRFGSKATIQQIDPTSSPITGLRGAGESTSSAYIAPLLESGGTESGVIRKFVWQGAVNAWRSSTKTYFIGTGTETFAFAFYQFKPKEHNLTSEWDFLYNKAHNEYLNYLATTGVFGLGSYLLFIGAFIYWFVKFQITSTKSQTNLKSQAPNWNLEFDTWCLIVALFAGWLSILVTNFFGFSVVIVQIFLFLFPAIVFELYQQANIAPIKQLKIALRAPRWAIWTVSVPTVGLLVLVGVTWHADTLFASGYRMSRAGQFGVGAAFLKRAVRLNPIEPYYYDELGGAYAGMVTDAIEGKDATTAATLVRLSLESSDRALSISPKNVNFWKTRTKIYYTFSTIDPTFTAAAITALEKARELSPTDPKIFYNLAILEGHRGANDKAIDLLRQAIDLKPNYRDAYYALWVFYTEVKKSDLARKILGEYIAKVDPGDKDFLERIKQ